MSASKSVVKRMRKTQIPKGELKLFYSLIPGQHERSICFRAAHYSTDEIDFYCIPVDDFDTAAKDGQPPEYIFPFQTTTTICRSSSFVAVGNTLYCVGGHAGRGNATPAIYRFDTTGDNRGSWYRNSFDMCCPRYGPGTIAMDGKLFVIGAAQQLSYDVPMAAEVFDPSSKSSMVVESPPKSLCENLIFVTAALRDRNEILVACTYWNVAYLLDVKTGAWVQFDPNVDFGAAVHEAAAVVLKTTMCWYSHSLHMLVAYDLNLKTWFKTCIKYLNRVGRRLNDAYCSTDISLFPLDENHLCFIWEDHVTPFLLHFTKVCVSLSDGKFRAVVACSRSYVVREKVGFIDGLLLDLSPTPEERRSTSRETLGKNKFI